MKPRSQTGSVFKVFILIQLCLSWAPTAAAQVEDLAPLLEPIAAKHQVPALAGAILDHEGLKALGVVGVRKHKDPTPVQPEDKWHLGSCTKAFTATLAGKLVEQGSLVWTTTLGQVWTGDQWLPTWNPAWKEVTLEALLGHRGAAPGSLSMSPVWSTLREGPRDPRADRLLVLDAVLSSGPPIPAPEGYRYSNAGFMMAASMMEKLTGKPYEDLLRDLLLQPLGLNSGGFGTPASPDQVDQPWGHGTFLGYISPVKPGIMGDNPPALAPAGTLHLSMGDWARFAGLHLAGARGLEGLLLNPGTFKRLHHPGPDQRHALGWGVRQREWARGRVLTHSGSNNSWYAVIWLAPELDLGFLVATNRGGAPGEQACDDALKALLKSRNLLPDSAD